MSEFSIAIICKNEINNIAHILQNVLSVTNDVVVYDSGSTDGSIEVIKQFNVQLHQGEWMGYGRSKQIAVSLTNHDWVLCLDADEMLDETLQEELKRLVLSDPQTVYRIPFKNYLGNKHLKWGEWGDDSHIRLFNKTQVTWDDAPVHERLIIPKGIKVAKLKGSVLHQTMHDTAEYAQKMVRYALLNAEKYFERGKKASWFKRHLSSRFSFLKHYVFELGFLDGWEGLVSAKMTSYYTFLKYARLHELNKAKNKKNQPF